jgi:hypothetical protein
MVHGWLLLALIWSQTLGVNRPTVLSVGVRMVRDLGPDGL